MSIHSASLHPILQHPCLAQGPPSVDDYLKEGPVRLPDNPGPKEECFDQSLALKSCID